MAQYDTTWFEKGLAELEITLNEKQIEQFLTYYELLVEWNKVMNLTAITEYEEVITKHFLDSVASVKVCDYSKPMKILDLGTGAGFPGIPLKIAFPDQEIVLLDSLNKRVKFLNTVIETLGLTGIRAIHGRAEDYARHADYREQFDLCVSRAVGNLSTLSEYCLALCKNRWSLHTVQVRQNPGGTDRSKNCHQNPWRQPGKNRKIPAGRHRHGKILRSHPKNPTNRKKIPKKSRPSIKRTD